MNIDKRKLIAAVAGKTNFKKWEIDIIIEPLLDAILEALENGEEVSLNNFGKFSLKYSKAKEAVHPTTHKRIKIPARASVVFKATRMFKPTDEAMTKLSQQKNK